MTENLSFLFSLIKVGCGKVGLSGVVWIKRGTGRAWGA